jgi:hypothetical protein
MDNFIKNEYLSIAKKKAKKNGYNPSFLFFSDNDTHKLMYDNDGKKIHFGRVGYGDNIIYNFLAKSGDITHKQSNMYKNRFQKSHTAISKIHNLGKYSPNELALKILW